MPLSARHPEACPAVRRSQAPDILPDAVIDALRVAIRAKAERRHCLIREDLRARRLRYNLRPALVRLLGLRAGERRLSSAVERLADTRQHEPRRLLRTASVPVPLHRRDALQAGEVQGKGDCPTGKTCVSKPLRPFAQGVYCGRGQVPYHSPRRGLGRTDFARWKPMLPEDGPHVWTQPDLFPYPVLLYPCTSVQYEGESPRHVSLRFSTVAQLPPGADVSGGKGDNSYSQTT